MIMKHLSMVAMRGLISARDDADELIIRDRISVPFGHIAVTEDNVRLLEALFRFYEDIGKKVPEEYRIAYRELAA